MYFVYITQCLKTFEEEKKKRKEKESNRLLMEADEDRSSIGVKIGIPPIIPVNLK